MTRRVMLILCLTAAGGFGSDAGVNGTIDAKAAFARLKTLVGEWTGTDPAKGERLSYELIAGGTSLVERESGEGRPVMVTVYHLDGKRLMLTHYCMAGNQPRMEAREFDAETGRLRFDFVDATGLKSKDAGHMHFATLRIADADHLGAEWVFYEGGKPTMKETSEYTRVR
jgi:hypothetical protein